jgi:hypothetical protein
MIDMEKSAEVQKTCRHYCTYFDSRYLPRGLALYHSLVRHAGNFCLWVLCLDEACLTTLRTLNLPNLRALPLAELEVGDPELRATKDHRSLIEYYFTCSPCWPYHILKTAECSPHEITYLDSDLYFFSSPEPVFDELAEGSVAIVPHRLTPEIQRKFGRFGAYNVGWLTFRATPDGLACLDWWRQRCIDWCFDRVEADRYADQKYLERFQELFPGVVVIQHPGVNLAPWNLGRHTVSCQGKQVLVDGKGLIFFHFQGLSQVAGRIFDGNLVPYRACMTKMIRREIFQPYVTELYELQSRYAADSPNGSLRKKNTSLARLINRFGRLLRQLRAAAAGSLVWVLSPINNGPGERRKMDPLDRCCP